MASNVLYIGLGGTGVKTVANVRKLYAEHARAGTPSYRAEFLFADTDSGDTKASLSKDFAGEFALNQRFIDFEVDWVDLGGFNPAAAWREIQKSSLPKDLDIKGWISTEQANKFDDKIIYIGANANRQLGRLCFAHHVEHLRKQIGQKLDALIDKHDQDARNPKIIIVTSSCGGTGSSIFFDLCYLVSAIAYPRVQALPKILGIIAAPGGYLEAMKNGQMGAELISRVKVNAYAFFVELDDAVKRNGPQRQFFALPSDVDVKSFEANWRPFQGAGIVDVQMEKTSSFINLKELPKVVGESLFYLHSTSGDNRLDSVFTNLETETSDYFFAFGLKTLAYPSLEMGQYLSARFFYDVIGDRFLANSAAEKDLNERADKIMARLSASFDKVRDDTWHGLLNDVFDKSSIADRVSKVDAKGDEEIDPALVTAEVLEQWQTELKHLIDGLKRTMQRAFGDWAGQPKSGDGGAFVTLCARP
jgi:Tubulin like